MVSLRDHISDAHRRAAKTFGFALHADESEIWLNIGTVWLSRLTERERAAAAYSLLRTLEPEHQQLLFDALFEAQDMPLAPLFDPVAEASDWAFFAEPKLRKAMALACFNNFMPQEQDAFLAHISSQRRAA